MTNQVIIANVQNIIHFFVDTADGCNLPLLESPLLEQINVSAGDPVKAFDIIHGRATPLGNDGFWKPEFGDLQPYIQVFILASEF